MPHVKIYGLKTTLPQARESLSKAIHESLMETLGTGENKLFQRYISLDEIDFKFPSDRTEKYTIIEISMFEGRDATTKKELIKSLFSKIEKQTNIKRQDIEITLFEIPKCNWGIRGILGENL